MAQWSYSSWPSQTTDAARLAMLRLHIGEVSDEIAARTAAPGGRSYDPTPLSTYLETLLRIMRDLESVVGDTVTENDPRVTATFTRGRPI